MIRREAEARRKSRGWRCQAMLDLEQVVGFPKESHTCTLVRNHYFEHLCWCGVLFGEDGALVAQQLRLPPA